MTRAQNRLLLALIMHSAAERAKFPESNGWVQWWNVVDSWGRTIPGPLLGTTASRAWWTLEQEGYVEAHPDHDSLVRPTLKAMSL